MWVPITTHKQKNTWGEEYVHTSTWDLKRQYKVCKFGLKVEIHWSLKRRGEIRWSLRPRGRSAGLSSVRCLSSGLICDKIIHNKLGNSRCAITFTFGQILQEKLGHTYHIYQLNGTINILYGGFDIKKPTRVDKPLNNETENQTKQKYGFK